MAYVSGNFYVTDKQRDENAMVIGKRLLGRGWTRNAVAGILGNMAEESRCNHAMWNALRYGNWSVAYGLVQWLPARNLKSNCDKQGFKYNTLNGQLDWIQYEVEHNIQWACNGRTHTCPPFSFKEFTQSELDPQTLSRYFTEWYERPEKVHYPKRLELSQKYYEMLDGESGTIEEGSGYQLAILPLQKGAWHLSQGGYDDTTFSHQGTTAMDWSTGACGSPYYAPCDCECIRVTNTNRHIVVWKSTNKVMCADGNLRWIIWDCIHEGTIWQTVGMKLKKGELMGHTGEFGPNVHGCHLHMQVIEGKTFPGYTTNQYGRNTMLGKTVDPWLIFATNGCDITNLGEIQAMGYDYHSVEDWEDGSGGSDSDGGDEQPDARNVLINILFMCDALRGTKGGWK